MMEPIQMHLPNTDGSSPVALEAALDQSLQVKAKVRECADDLASSNEIVKKTIASGRQWLSAPLTLVRSEKVEDKVQGCAEDLHQVNQDLARGIAQLKRSESALKASQQELAGVKAELIDSQHREQKALVRALHDAATGLPNRDLFNDRLSHAIALAERHDWTLAVMFLDLDNFKTINDEYGHAAGDAVLKEVAQRLLAHAREEDTVCRNGGDEFLYLLMDPKGAENIERIADAVLTKIARPIRIDTFELVVRPSIGIAVYPDNGITGDELVRNADTAMYEAKRSLSGWMGIDDMVKP